MSAHSDPAGSPHTGHREHEHEQGAGPDARPPRRSTERNFENSYPVEQPALGVPPHRSWHRRPRSPGLHWHRPYTEEGLKKGRVLMIDYVKKDHTKEGMRKVAAQEISDVEGLRRVYANPEMGREAVLRVFHVQNADWANRFLVRKFNIDSRDNLVGTDFGNWVKRRKPERRAGKPNLSGKTWRTQHDPWRGISRTAFGLDYLKQYSTGMRRSTDEPSDQQMKMMELNCFDENENSTYGFDVYVQRLSVYIQHKDISPQLPTDPDIRNPYVEGATMHGQPRQGYFPQLDTLDNGNAIIIFENCQSNSIEDTLIAARGEWESRWRRLPFYLAYESHDVSNDDRMAVECMKMILEDIFRSLVSTWDTFLDISYTHVSILEDKIYEQPADESRAPELWTNSSQWLKVEKLMTIHVDVVKEMRLHLTDLTDDIELDTRWLENSPDDFQRLTNLVEEDLVKPTANLADLLYKSVGIRDSRQSLQLGTSMWRLSWITFIFLPLTFIVGFFGMNVDTFHDDPSIKWYFISAVPFMLLILVLWYVLKHAWARQRQTPYQRGIYENLFHSLALAHPSLWSRNGPRDYVRPITFWGRIKWRLITYWAQPSKTILMRAPGADAILGGGDDGLGSWSQIKRKLMWKWSQQLQVQDVRDVEDGVDGSELLSDDDAAVTGASKFGGSEVTELHVLSTNGVRPAPGASRLGVPITPAPREVRPATTPRPTSAGSVGSGSDSRGGSAGRNSGMLVEEKETGWLRIGRDIDRDLGWRGRAGWRRSSRDAAERTSVSPAAPGPQSPRGETSLSPTSVGPQSQNMAENRPGRQPQRPRGGSAPSVILRQPTE